MQFSRAILFCVMLASTRLTAQPVINSQPTDQTVVLGGTATFSVTATGVGPLTYQWQFNGTNLPNNIITTFAGNGNSGNSGDGGPATNASLTSVYGLAMDRFDNLYIAAQSSIREVTSNGIIKTVATGFTFNYPGDGSPATNAGVMNTSGVAVDTFGNFFFSDINGRNVVRKVNSNGIITTVAGSNIRGVSGDGGPSTNALLSTPEGLAFDASGSLFIADYANQRIRRVDTNGIITTVAGGRSDFSDGIQATNAGIVANGLTFDPAGNFFIFGDNRLHKIDTNGIITRFAGNFFQNGFSGDGGPATNALLRLPFGAACDANGNVFVADSGNRRIRKIDTNGIITTVAGNGTVGFSGDGGAATDASMVQPYSVVFDSTGNLLIADQSDRRIRKVFFAGSPSRSVINVSNKNVGSYQVIVTSPSGSITSSIARLFLSPQIQVGAPGFGVRSNRFGFNLTGTSNQVVVVETSTNLATSQWLPLQTNTLTTNILYFSDPDWTNFSGRYYRVRSP